MVMVIVIVIAIVIVIVIVIAMEIVIVIVIVIAMVMVMVIVIVTTHVWYIKIPTRLRGFSDKIATFSRLHCLAITRRKKTKPNIEKWPDSLLIMLKFYYIERGIL